MNLQEFITNLYGSDFILWVGFWGPTGDPHGPIKAPLALWHNWELLNIVLQNLQEITRMLKGSNI